MDKFTQDGLHIGIQPVRSVKRKVKLGLKTQTLRDIRLSIQLH